MKFAFFLLLVIAALTDCQSPVVPANRALQCYVRFDAVRHQVQADITLQEGLTPVEMPGGFFYQGSEMRIIPVQGLTYRRTYAADFIPEHTFSWKDEKGAGQKLTFQMAAIPAFTFGEKALSRKQPATLRWQGGALEKGEALTLIWENKEHDAIPMDIVRSGGEASIEFPAAKIAELPAGEWTVYLVRKKLAKTTVDGIAAEAVLEYYSKSDTVQVR